MRSKAALASTVLVALLARGASANDSTFGGTGAELIPLVETRIRMASEDIVLELGPEGWHVDARYVFENPTDEAVKVEMGFPEQHCEPDSDCWSSTSGHFQGLRTTVRGTVVEQREGTVDKTHDWAPRLGKVWLYSVELAPHERVEVVHQYGYDPSTFVDGDTIDYVTRTGKLWNGPIGSARFVVRTPDRPWMLEYPQEFVLTSLVERRGGPKRGMTEIVFEMKEWTPTGDFHLLMANPFRGMEHLPGDECPSFHRVSQLERARTKSPTAAGELAAELAKFDAATLRVCRNAPYAAHGRPFASRRLRKHFYLPPIVGDFGDDGRDWVRAGMRPNPHYERGLLTNDELAYVSALKRRR
ncbi:MAG TPA: DUF4424 family protein [Nannocystaceae bacterium]|nr:DUF4424 family protein [Nannocystaceae bacterium]